jgi:hypothetical protein
MVLAVSRAFIPPFRDPGDPFNGANKVYRQPAIAIPQGIVGCPTAPPGSIVRCLWLSTDAK